MSQNDWHNHYSIMISIIEALSELVVFLSNVLLGGLCGLGRYVFESDRERHAKYPVIITILAQPAANVWEL